MTITMTTILNEIKKFLPSAAIADGKINCLYKNRRSTFSVDLGYISVNDGKLENNLIDGPNNMLEAVMLSKWAKSFDWNSEIAYCEEEESSSEEAQNQDTKISIEYLAKKYVGEIDKYQNIRAKSNAANDAIYGEGCW